MQRIGSAIGIAVVSSVLFGVANLPSLTSEIATKVANAMKEGLYTSPELAAKAISKASLATHFGDAATMALLVSAIFAIVAVALVFALPKRVNLH
jgi:putative copper export protein